MLPFADIIARTLLAFFALVVISRFIGQPFKVLSGIAAGGLAALVALDRTIAISHAVTALVTWSVLAVLTGVFALKSKQFGTFVNGKPTPLIQSGKVLEKNLRKSRMTVNEMAALLREKDAFKLADVEFATLEPDGQLSVLLKSDSQPMTPKTLNLSVQNESMPWVVVVDGQVVPTALTNSGYDRPWLYEQIKANGATGWQDVLLAQIDAKGKVYVDLYDDSVTQPPSRDVAKPLVLASLKKMQADLEVFAMQTNNQAAKDSYTSHATKLEDLVKKLAPHMRS